MQRPGLIALFIWGIGVAAFPLSGTASLGRDRDPAVLDGGDFPGLLGKDPARLAAFSWNGGWTQVPLQVDERAIVDFGAIYDTTDFGLPVLTYTDPETFTGPDPDPALDIDDELALRARDADLRAPGVPEPPGTVAGTGVEITLTDSLSAATAFIYVFESDGSLDPGTGIPAIENAFTLTNGSGIYLNDYNTVSGPNPEDTWIVTPFYAVHFADRWIRDVTRFEGTVPGPDLLDRHKNLFAPGNCSRSEDTFSNGEGAVMATKPGPVRAIRSYVGANSGVTTYRSHAFYEAREDILTALRVHAISGVMDYMDYSPDAAGMTYHNDLNPAGVPVDGSPDAIVSGAFAWEMLTGSTGTLVHTPVIRTDIPGFNYTSYYADDTTPSVTQCTGDGQEYAASGTWVQTPLPNTDPGLGPHNILEITRVITYARGPRDVAFAEQAAAEAKSPIQVQTADYIPASTGIVEDGLGGVRILGVAPNPARSRATIRFTQEKTGPVSLALYDVRGRQVEMLLSETRPAGVHTVTIDLRTLPAGLYFLRAGDGAGRGRASRLIHLP